MSSKLLQVLNTLIKEGYITDSSMGSIRNDTIFKRLVSAEVIEKEPKGAGHIWKVQKKEALIENKNYYFPDNIDDIASDGGARHKNVRSMRNSKSTSRESYRLFFMRSNVSFNLNSNEIFLSDNKPIGSQLDSLVANKVCFVENLENFMEDNIFINQDWTLVYVNGRIGKEFIERIKASEIMHWGDLDYVGLDEYCRIKAIFPNADLYVPPNYFKDAEKYSISIETKQKASTKLLELAKIDSKVAKVLEYLYRQNAFLEQEGYSHE